jgi:hypothetical protein
MPVTLHALLVAAARFALAAVPLAGAAALVGAGQALAQFALGAGVLALALFFGRSRRSLEGTLADADEVPPDAVHAPLREGVVAALFPSSVGVAILGTAALALDASLAAILAGLLAAMGFASLVSAVRVLDWERRHSARAFADRRSEAVFVADAPRQSWLRRRARAG